MFDTDPHRPKAPVKPEPVIPAVEASSVGGLSVVSLFSGAGGFDAGFALAGGYQTLLSNEKREAAARTFAKNFFNVEEPSRDPIPSVQDLPLAVLSDVQDLVLKGLGDTPVDVLIGGPPCQDFSVMKGQKRDGTEVNRGRLYTYFVRALATLRPRAFVFENVPGLVSANGGEALEAIRNDLRDPPDALRRIDRADSMGWSGMERHCEYELLFGGGSPKSSIVDAPHLGVPQTRRRVIIVGVRKEIRDRLGVFRFEQAREVVRHKLGGHGTLFRRFPLTCMETFEGRPLVELQEHFAETMDAWASLADAMPGHHGAVRWVEEARTWAGADVRTAYLRRCQMQLGARCLFEDADFDEAMEEHEEVLRLLGYYGRRVSDVEAPDGSSTIPRVNRATRERMERIPPGENYAFVDGTEWRVSGRGLSLIYRRPFPLEPAPTVVAFGGGGTYGYHYARNRVMLSNRERARLQTFPDDFFFCGDASQLRAQIGEAVPPLLAARIAEHLTDLLT